MKSGFENIDADIPALETRRIYAFAAPEAMGKLTFVRQLALNASLNNGVLYVQFKSNKQELLESLLSVKGAIPHYEFDRKPLEQKTAIKVEETLKSLEDHHLFMERLNEYDEMDFYKLIRSYVNEHNVKLIIIDDLDTMFGSCKQELDQTKRCIYTLHLKAMIHEYDCCCIMLTEVPKYSPSSVRKFCLPGLDELGKKRSLIKVFDEMWMFLRLEYFGVQVDDIGRITERKMDIIRYSYSGKVLDFLYFKFNENYTSLESLVFPFYWDDEQE